MNYRFSILIIIILFMFSCDGKIVVVDCGNCTETEPTSATIYLRMNPQDGTNVIVKIYKGLLENGIQVDSFNTQSDNYTYTGDLNTIYTFTAEYQNYAGPVYVAVNSAYPRVKYEKQQCENNCYFIYNNKVDLRLKYQ